MTHDDSTLQAAIDAAFQTNGKKHCGNLVTSKHHTIYWPDESPARLAVAKAFLAALPPAEQSAEIEKLKAELASLQQWKSEQLQVESEWNPQMLANKLGVGLGQSCRAGIQKAVLALLEQPSLSRLRPIAEAGPVPEGCVRTFAWLAMSNAWCYTASQESWITHFADIILPTSEAEQKADLYAKLKAAHAAGKVIQTKWTNHGWKDNPSPDWTLPPERYRIKPEPKTFEAHGKTWTRHTPGDPCPVEGHVLLNVLWRWELQESSIGFSEERADTIEWGKKEDARYAEVIGWRYADESQPEPAQPWQPAVGDVVRLKSGGAHATVKGLTSDGLVSCIWFTANGQYHQFQVPAACLELVRKEKP